MVIKARCAVTPYSADEATSCLYWGTRYYSPDDKSSESKNTHDWDAAREGYYTVLSGKAFSGELIWSSNQSDEKKEVLKTFFSDLGQVLHLLQDMAVPAHVRSDFMSHTQWAGINLGNLLNPLKWWKEQDAIFYTLNVPAGYELTVENKSRLEVKRVF